MTRKPLLDVLAQKIPRRRPIWFMRQAGRYLPEYRKIRERAGSFLDLCYNPKLAAEITLQPMRRYDLDAAIVFADILVVPHAMGLGLRFEEGEGPVLERVGDLAGVRKLGRVAGSRQLQSICETLQRVKPKLPEESAFIGFCGGPWTLASYMIEGGSSERETARLAAYEAPQWFSRLMAMLIEQSVDYLSAQVVAGADVLQIFDSWAGDLSAGLRDKWVVAPLAEIARQLGKRHPEVPVIIFARGAGPTHRNIAEATKAQAVGIETELAIDWIASFIPDTCAVQGNLDPLVLLTDETVIKRETEKIAGLLKPCRHIFNLGHGIRPQTDPGSLQMVIDTVRQYDRDYHA